MLAVIRFPHAKDVTVRATRGVANHHQAACKQAIADDSDFTVVLARVLDLQRDAAEHQLGILDVIPGAGEIEPSDVRVVPRSTTSPDSRLLGEHFERLA